MERTLESHGVSSQTITLIPGICWANTLDLHRLDLNLLVSLDALLAERHVTRAAQRLGLSQPTLSAQLKQLRAAFGDPLLLPAARGMTPTQRATEIQASLRGLLAQIETLVAAHQTFDPARATHTFRIASTDSIHAEVGVPLAARLRQLAPQTRLVLLPVDFSRLAEQLAAGELDLVLAASSRMPAAVKVRTLYESRFLCVLRRGHPAAQGPLDLDVFCALEHALVSPGGTPLSGTVDGVLARMGRSRRVVVSVSSFLLVQPLVAESDLIATVPSRQARQWTGALEVLAPPCEIPGFTVQMGWHPRSHADPAHAWLRENVAALVDGGQAAPVGIPNR
ncbi:MAG: LysR family transcriptional regulator [Curvibacter sp.]|nr:LysR family transcriptional regulator [Curvibacter sp.]